VATLYAACCHPLWAPAYHSPSSMAKNLFIIVSVAALLYVMYQLLSYSGIVNL
jgi:hypothetical protein